MSANSAASETRSVFSARSSSNFRDLADEVRAGRFREDLYFRIAVMDLKVEPLRQRPDDIPLLARHFLRQVQGPVRDLAPAALRILVEHSWPGNVRELQNAIERAAVEAEERVIQPRDLPSRVFGGVTTGVPSRRSAGAPQAASVDAGIVGPTGVSLAGAPESERAASTAASPQTLEEIERDAIAAALARNRGNVAQVVRELGIGRTTLYRKIKKYGLR
jgi:DNA-binding NtrC family response regulator